MSLAAFLGTAEVVAVATGPASQPEVALGRVVIARTPEWLKNFAISNFGENDKLVLNISVYAALIVLAGLAGALAGRTRTWAALGALTALGTVTAVAAATGPSASAWQSLPSVAGAIAGAAVFVSASARGGRAGRAGVGVDSGPGGSPTLPRRQFLKKAGSLFALSAGAYAVGRGALARAYNAAASRAAVRLPRAVRSTPRVAGTGFEVEGLSPYITPNKDFYRVDTALVVPQLSTDGYILALHGMVERPAIFTFDDLLHMPLVEAPITMVCVSDPVGGPYVGNARWLGVPLAHLLGLVGPRPGADQLFMTSADGMTIGADLRAAMDGRPALLAVGMNGEPLPFEHGFPVRAVIPGFYGYASACKWLVDLEVTTYEAKKAYWVQRGYAQKGAVRLESRIDTPAPFAQLRAGPVTVAGSAWHPTVGIRKVQVSADGGPWHEAALADVESVDTWRLWRWEWEATPGSHSLQVRAVGNDGQVQTAAGAPVFPAGATGRQSLVVSVT